MRIRDKAITIYSNGGMNQSPTAKAGSQGVQYADFLTEQRQKAEEERAHLLEQLRDPESGLYGQMQAKALSDERKLLELKREQATLDALSAMLDSLSAKESGGSLAEAGAALARNADQEALREGYLPLELQVYLSVLTGRTAFETAEPEDTEAEKLREREAERLSDGGGLTEADIGALAEDYDPRHMEREEFLELMDRLAELGALENAEALKNTGGWIVTVRDESGNVVEPLRWKNGESLTDSRLLPFLYGEYSMEGDVLAWARLGGGNSDFRRLTAILERMEAERNQSSKPTTAKI